MGENLQNTQHDYVPNIVFHSHSSNIPHLFSWIDEIIQKTEKSLPKRSAPSTSDLVDSIYRYDACFRELLRQTSIFSESITKLLGKVWIGVLNLLDYMVKLYHRHVKQTSRLQEEAQRLVNERQSQLVSAKVKQEENELEITALRAKIRNIESELECMNISQTSLEKENTQLRVLLEEYIKGNETAKDIEKNMKNKNPSVTMYDPFAIEESNPSAQTNSQQGQTLLGASGSAKLQLEALTKLDLDMNEVMFKVLQEEDRQHVVLSDLLSLVAKNPTVFGNPKEVPNPEVLVAKGVRQLEGQRRATCSVGIQADGKDIFAVVDEVQVTVNKERAKADKPPPKPSQYAEIGANVPYQFRQHMTYFPTVLRIPPLEWVSQTILSIYLYKIGETESSASTSVTAAPSIKRLPMSSFTYHFFRRQFGLSVMTDIQVMQFLMACEYHVSNKRVLTFAKQLGLNAKEFQPEYDIRDTDFILMVLQLVKSIEEPHGRDRDTGAEHQKPSKFTYSPLAGTPGGMARYISKAAAISLTMPLFERWVYDRGEDFVRKVQAVPPSQRGPKFILLDDFIEVAIEQWLAIRENWSAHLRFLFHQHAALFRVVHEIQFANDLGAVDRDAVLVQVDGRVVLEENGLRPLRSFMRADMTVGPVDAHSPRLTGGGNVNQQQQSVGAHERGQPKAGLFARSAVSGDVDAMSRVPGGGGGGGGGTSSVNSVLSPGSNSSVPGVSGGGSALSHGQGQGQANAIQKEPLVELMNKRGFTAALQSINPKLTLPEIEEAYEAACQWAMADTERALEQYWSTALTSGERE